MSVRFVHTADWQIGMRAAFVPGDAGAIVRDERIRAVRRIAAVVAETRAEFVVVAGDVFEHHGLRPDTIHKTLDALRSVPAPVYLLPGNHDPYTHDSIWRSALWRRECPDHVHVLSTTEPVRVREGVVLLPCPLLTRHTVDDPTAHLAPDLGPSDAVRIAVAHGGIREFLARVRPDEGPVLNGIAQDVAERARLDYVALGDWHGTLRWADRTWYSGTPEPTAFDESDPGNVLVVDIPGPGVPPAVTPRRVAGLAWVRHRLEVGDDADPGRIRAWSEALSRREDTLAELTLVGTVSAEAHAELMEEVDRAGHRLRFLRVRAEGLHGVMSEADLAGIAPDGWIKDVVDGLREDPSDDAGRALGLLYRLHKELDR